MIWRLDSLLKMRLPLYDDRPFQYFRLLYSGPVGPFPTTILEGDADTLLLLPSSIPLDDHDEVLGSVTAFRKRTINGQCFCFVQFVRPSWQIHIALKNDIPIHLWCVYPSQEDNQVGVRTVVEPVPEREIEHWLLQGWEVRQYSSNNDVVTHPLKVSRVTCKTWFYALSEDKNKFVAPFTNSVALQIRRPVLSAIINFALTSPALCPMCHPRYDWYQWMRRYALPWTFRCHGYYGGCNRKYLFTTLFPSDVSVIEDMDSFKMLEKFHIHTCTQKWDCSCIRCSCQRRTVPAWPQVILASQPNTLPAIPLSIRMITNDGMNAIPWIFNLFDGMTLRFVTTDGAEFMQIEGQEVTSFICRICRGRITPSSVRGTHLIGFCDICWYGLCEEVGDHITIADQILDFQLDGAIRLGVRVQGVPCHSCSSPMNVFRPRFQSDIKICTNCDVISTEYIAELEGYGDCVISIEFV